MFEINNEIQQNKSSKCAEVIWCDCLQIAQLCSKTAVWAKTAAQNKNSLIVSCIFKILKSAGQSNENGKKTYLISTQQRNKR